MAPLLDAVVSRHIMINDQQTLYPTSCFVFCDYISYTGTFPFGSRLGGVSPYLKVLWMINPSSVLPSKAQGKPEGHRCLPSPSLPCHAFTAFSPHSHCTCPVSGTCSSSASCLFSQSGLHSRCSSKCFQLCLFTILLQNRNCIHAVALQISKEKTLHSSLSTSLEPPPLPFSWAQVQLIRRVYLIMLLSSAPFSTSRCLSLQPDYCIILF